MDMTQMDTPDASLLRQPLPVAEAMQSQVTSAALMARRGEVVMTVQDAKKKKLPKGYAYEPIAPPALLPPEPDLDPVASEGKRARRQTPKAIQAVNTFSKRGPGASPRHSLPSTTGFYETGVFDGTSTLPQQRFASAEDDASEKARKKEAKRQLKEELARIRAVQQQAEEKEQEVIARMNSTPTTTLSSTTPIGRAIPSTPSAMTSTSDGFKTPLNGAPTNVLIPPASAEPGPDGRAKRTPKANSFYTSGVDGDFLTGNVKIPAGDKSSSKSKGKTKTMRKSSSKLNPRQEKRKKVENDRVLRLERLFHHCASVLRNVESRNRNACLFLEPVDGNLIPDYYSVITNPMDFRTIKERLEAKYYETPAEYCADVRLVFANCRIYNKPESVEANMGVDVEADFERRWVNSKITEKWEQELARRDAEEFEISNTTTKVDPDRALSAKKSGPCRSGGGSSLKRKASAGSREPSDSSRPMNFEEKRSLSAALEQLPAEKLDRVVEIIQESNSLGNEDDKEELELDIDLLDPVTLWKLHRYANSCMKPARKAARGSAGPQMLHSEFSDAGSFGHKAGSNSGAQPESSSCSGSSTSSG
mmetsp:Transcript_31626/g.60976  ORF Transcript_31626/g.60976 Transcript_31626/m.60976 type:complete len:590 (-) Transcript_31626:229-1998(-)